MNKGTNFIALDLETATWNKSSICEIGIAIVMALKDAGQDIEIMSEEQFLSMLGVELHE